MNPPLSCATPSAPADHATGDGAVPPAPGPWPSLRALCSIARLHQVAADPAALAHELGLSADGPVTHDDLLRAAKHLGLKAKLSVSSAERLVHTPLPALAMLRRAEGDAGLVILAQCDGQRVLFHDPATAQARPCIQPLDSFAAQWTGELILVASRAGVGRGAASAPFDFSWFVPSLVKYRRLLGEVLLISLVLQLFALAGPLFFQVVMDKVLVHRGLNTLDVLVVGLAGIVVFESVLATLRNYVFSHTTSRIDVELGARLFRHLVQLPMAYFQGRRVGDSVARVRELDHIRGFLTGSALTALVDAAFSVLFLAVMFFYSVPLTLVVLASLPLYVGLSLAVVPILRRRLEDKFARGAENQAMLVETISGMQAVKAGALEPGFARRWDNQLAAYVSASFRTQHLAGCADELVNLIGKLTAVVLLWWGARLVIAGELTVGQFVAFNMFAQRVSLPIRRLAQMWTQFQQAGVSMARVADILDARSEAPTGASQLPALRGDISFENVVFRYRPEAPPALQGITLDVKAGEVLGIVGRSGSGKSTLARLVQRLYQPESGRLRIDGIDIGLIDPAPLRRQIGVVMQENPLFNRSVRENIAIADPAAPIEAVIRAARLAGAHEFIGELSEGYDTVVGEQGSSLSSGQRQRLAIARALFTNPRILILDEATGALDYESEAIIQRNMKAICRDRTVLIIAHRLSAVRSASRIVVMDRGRIVEAGSQQELLARQRGLFSHLWRLQQQADTPLGETA